MGVTISDVAKKAKVSVGTVTRVFHRNPTVNTELVERVNAAARALGYIPRQASKEDTIAFLIEEQTSHALGGYLSVLFEELLSQAHKNNLRIDVFIPSDIPLIRGGFLVGAISLLWKKESLDLLGNLRNIPLVSINEELEGISSVCSNEEQGVQQAVDYFIAGGHERLGLLILDEGDNWCRRQRLRTFKRLLREKQLPVFKDQIQLAGSPARVAYHLNRLLFKGKPSGLLLTGEGVGMQVMHNLDILGIKVPEQLSIIGNDLKYVSEYFSPPQTCIAQGSTLIAKNAIELLMQLSGKRDEKQNEVLRRRIDNTFIERDSVLQL